MAATFDAVGPSSSGGGTTGSTDSNSASWSHTCSGSNIALIVGVAIGVHPDTGVTTGVTYRGNSLSSLGKIHAHGDEWGYIEVFGALGVSAGSGTVAISVSSNATISGGSVTVNGADSFRNAILADGDSATPLSVDVTGTTEGSLIVDSIVNGQSITSPGANQTLRWLKNTNQNTAGGNGASSTSEGTGETVNLSYTKTADWWGLVAVEILPTPEEPEYTDPPEFVASYQDAENNSPVTLQTASFTPRENEVLVCKVTAGHSTVTVGTPSGGGLTWTDQGSSNTTNYTPTRIFTAVVGASPSPMTVSVGVTGSVSGVSPTLSVERWAYARLDASPVGVVARNTTGGPSTTMTPENADGVITWVCGDWNPSSGGTVTYRSSATEVYRRRDSSINVWTAYQPSVALSSQTIGLSAPTGQKWTIVGVELIPGPAPVEPAGSYTDELNISFSASGDTSTYHRYADDIDPESPVGLLMYFHGDGGYDYDQVNDFPADYYALPGPLGVVEQARSRNMITIAPRTPDSDDTWWTDGANMADWAKALFDDVVTEYEIDTSIVWFVGFSGGAQFITQFLMPEYPAMATGGGAIMFGGGGDPITSPGTFGGTLKANFPMVFYTGQKDIAANSPGEGYDGYLEAQDGAEWYEDEGFTVYRDFPENVDHTDLEYKFGPVVGYYMERVGWGALSSTTTHTFNSGTEFDSGNWTRITSSPTPYEGAGALKSATPNEATGGNSDATFTVPADALGMRFRYQIESEDYADFLQVAVDSDYQPMAYGLSPYGWSESAPYDVSDASTVTFRYRRDAGGGQGGNAVWIDSIVFEYEAGSMESGRFFLAV